MPWVTLAWNWLLRLIGGWIPLGNKPIGEWLGKILWAVGIFLVCMIVWNKFTKPTQNTVIKPDQDAEQIVNVYHQETVKPGFGCASLRVLEFYKDKKEEAKK